MDIKIPTTKQQENFEELAKIMLQLLSELSEEERNRIFNHVVNTYNKRR